MNSTFTFDNKSDYFNSSATSANSSSWTTISTFVSPSDHVPRVTIVKSPYGNEGSIHWQDRKFTLNGEQLEVDDVRFKETGAGSLFSRRWFYQKSQWRIKYIYDSKTWMVWRYATSDVAEETPSAKFKIYESKVVGKSVPASLFFHPSLSESDAHFIVLALLYSETTEHAPAAPRGFGDVFAVGITALFRSAPSL
ncbi:hypothetical protein H0H81_000514 [Sphagnurus paluster]|uniref:Uncharacterized protein n=1 Tax=Sphagnurus paluster TaxID=117069 RepID=A0A9P7FPD5_9AGAR|nr:hypothetical protein H0H81_000514 [Sphagnurus paluster]